MAATSHTFLHSPQRSKSRFPNCVAQVKASVVLQNHKTARSRYLRDLVTTFTASLRIFFSLRSSYTKISHYCTEEGQVQPAASTAIWAFTLTRKSNEDRIPGASGVEAQRFDRWKAGEYPHRPFCDGFLDNPWEPDKSCSAKGSTFSLPEFPRLWPLKDLLRELSNLSCHRLPVAPRRRECL